MPFVFKILSRSFNIAFLLASLPNLKKPLPATNMFPSMESINFFSGSSNPGITLVPVNTSEYLDASLPFASSTGFAFGLSINCSCSFKILGSETDALVRAILEILSALFSDIAFLNKFIFFSDGSL